MANRGKRLKLLTEHRQKQLDDRVSELHACARAEAEAQAEEKRALELCHSADAKRAAAAQQGVESGTWVELNNWLHALQHEHRLAVTATFKAGQVTKAAQQKVLKARAQLKQVETLAERMREREAAEERRREQRMADEHTQQMNARRGENA